MSNLRIALILVSAVITLLAMGCGGGAATANQPPPNANPTPTITAISPNGGLAGGAAFTLTINGTNFISASMVGFNGSAPATTFVNSTQLTAAIPAASISSTGTMAAVTVINPAPGGGTSNPMNFITSSVPNAAPSISSFYPSCAPAGEQFVDSTNNQLTVSGLNFVADSVMLWDGTDRPTTLDGNSLGKILTAQISGSDIATAGTSTVTVFNPAPGGGTSNSLTFTATPGAVDPQSIFVDPTGKFAYVASSGCSGGVVGYVSMYTVNSTTGALTSVGPPVSSLDSNAGSVTVSPSGMFAYVTNMGDDFSSDGSVVMYSINGTTGALISTGTISGNCPGLCVPQSLAVDRSGKFAYVPNGDGLLPDNVAMYTVNASTGALTPMGTITAGGFASSLAVDPSGKFVYVATENPTPGVAGSVSMYTINTTTGALTFTGTIAAETGPVSVAVDPAGKFAYVANSASGDVSMYTINAANGALTSTGTIAAGTDPVSVTVDPSGKFVYVVNSSSNDVSMYTIVATTGALTPIGTIPAWQNPTSIAVHPSGKFAYVTNSGANDVSIYSIDTTTGVLTFITTVGT